MALDAFLELKKGGKPAIEGETTDKIFGAKHRRAVQLISFDLESQIDLATREADASIDLDTPTVPGQSSTSTSKDTGDDDEDYFTFTISKEVDNATPQLFQFFCKFWTSTRSPGKVLPSEGIFDEAKVTIRKAAGKDPIEYLVFEFREVWIRSWELTNKDGDDLPEEEIEFAFNACQMRYWPQKTTGARGVMIPTGFFSFRSNSDD